MSKKFGAGKQPTGTPSLGWSFVVAIVSLLAGASVVHSIYKPNLTLPPVESVDAAAKEKETGTNTFLPANLHWISQYWLAGWYPRGFVLFPRTEASRLSP
ncbi:hypothetical protein NC652_026478 [Populus alba x Populus x berolinensis]|uniref:Uncharacterized protein n=1 Tax=Populus alba x Populus x berolinensis TaxID=444605 RepID=A0AAD6MDM2_9ROSI|nr:hypothetical protein NC652_026478 [Populus alba x Populus x berolinensis]KAJ6983131.1 hypothetical protein NC653_026066 [Populus alba x Populus x berolinensis]KAJ6983144.1 hypothetical protein NC653_026073 [Populus alba x Populus x berolinensis]